MMLHIQHIKQDLDKLKYINILFKINKNITLAYVLFLFLFYKD